MGATLILSNPYLRDPEARKRAIFISVASSSAIEGIRAPFRKEARVATKVTVKLIRATKHEKLASVTVVSRKSPK